MEATGGIKSIPLDTAQLSQEVPQIPENDNNNPENQEASEEAFRKEEKAPPLSVPFKNDIGEQNSYVNVIIQLIHYTPNLASFFTSLGRQPREYKLLSHISNLLKKYNSLLDQETFENTPEEERVLDVFELRKELQKMYEGEELFKMKQTGDPADLLFIFLNSIHSYSMRAHSLKYSIEKECIPKCPSHELVWLNLIQQYECKSCKATSDILKFGYDYYIFEIQVKNIFTSKINKMNTFPELYNKFFIFAKEIISKSSNKQCPKKCKNQDVIKNTIILSPNQNLYINISWKEVNPKLVDICKFFFCLPQSFNNSDIFQVYGRDLVKPYNIYGMICYWGGKYVSFFKTTDKGEGGIVWVYQEDKTILKIKSWKELIVHCIKNHYHPVMLFYRKTDSRASFYEDNSSLVDKDYMNIMKHCLKVDSTANEEEAEEKEESTSQPHKIRPGINLKKTADANLIKNIRNLQIIEERRKTKAEGEEINIEEEAKNEPSPTKGKKVIIGLRPGEWQCSDISCGNINNLSSFQCTRCKKINLKIFEIIMNRKMKNVVKIGTDSKAKKFETLNKKFNLKFYGVEGTQGNVSLGSIKRTLSTKSKIEPTKSSRISTQEKQKRGPQQLKKESHQIFSINEDGSWRCPHCKFFNEKAIIYCERCKKNQPKEGEEIRKEEKIPLVNGVKHYL